MFVGGECCGYKVETQYLMESSSRPPPSGHLVENQTEEVPCFVGRI